MKRHLLVPLALLALALPASALAKGAESATLQGPDLQSAIPIPGNGEPGGGSPLGQIAEFTGFYAQTFGQSPDPTTSRPPKGDLGPRYTLTYVMPGPNGARDRIAQDVYPYATPDPVTHMTSGQPFFDGDRTEGGWYVAPVALRQALVKVGLSPTAPSTDDGGSFVGGALLATIVSAGAILALGAAAMVILRRRPGAAATG
jgi:hypothetical protein